ncbi:TetR/AcrR family transcriptional regulator [Actinomadura logoneensis]|uniref:TetR/AcrR family transcriptional regulator n=1 Tax=Actinomadura logoneensis TaxID=2293572 RepID=A0A372JM18_9ACTN|nr:TetR-like C-terminal domain-containing protein [Actinomadura logoneensis]RFU41067.1 TetR/AcrR family transcriptional regulator [Actinomadura logoneensis]
MSEVSTASGKAVPAAAVRTRLLEAAARLLAQEGPKALTARRVAAEVGASTMVLYTHFGGMPELVRAVVDEGFERLAAMLADVPPSGDPLADLARLAAAYRANALANPNLYAVMFGGSVLAEICPDDQEIRTGRFTEGAGTFGVLVEATGRAMSAGLLPGAGDADPADVSAQLWSALHGYVMLELGGHFTAADEETVFLPLLRTLAVGLGAPVSDGMADAIRTAPQPASEPEPAQPAQPAE